MERLNRSNAQESAGERRRWTVRVENACIQSHTVALQVKDGCFVSAHTKLAGWNKAVMLSSERLATEWRDALYPVMRRRHGADVELVVEPIEDGIHRSDDALVRARIAAGNFAPNKPPAVGGADHKRMED